MQIQFSLTSTNDNYSPLASVLRLTIAVVLISFFAQSLLIIFYSSQSLTLAISNLIIHVSLLLFALVISHIKWQLARLTLTWTYLSYIINATLIWQENLYIQHFLLIGVLVSNGFYLRNEQKQKWFINALLISVFIVMENLFVLPIDNGQSILKLINSFTLAILICLTSVLMQRYTRQKWQSLKELQTKTNELLASFLPPPQYLLNSHWPNGYQERFDNVCVVFADLKGYTKLSRHYDDDEIVTILDSLYRQFDQLAHSHQIEKLKTNGDEYMAVSGLPFIANSVMDKQVCIENTLAFAQHLLSSVNKLFAQLHMPCDIRVGIAMGSVTGGVIGSKRPSFDVWGKTVNRAARLEQSVTPGYIAVCDVIARNLQTSDVYKATLVEHEEQSFHILTSNKASSS